MKQRYLNIYNRIKALLGTPNAEWQVIATEPDTSAGCLKVFVFPIMLGIVTATFLGYLFFALTIHNFTFLYVVLKTASVFCESFFSFYVTTLIVFELRDKLKITSGHETFFRLMAYSFAGFWAATFVSGILANYNTLGSFLRFLGLYGVFVFWVGAPILQVARKYDRSLLAVVTMLVAIVVYKLINWSFGFALQAVHFSNS